MRPSILLWLEAHGLPSWLTPDYAAMVGLAGIVGAFLAMRLSRRDGAAVEVEARALAVGYAAALLGGYVFEWVRAVPEALREGSLNPILTTGRAAYGGLLAGVTSACVYVRRSKQPVVPFLDRLTVTMGVAFAFVRVGCFFAGCDYGKPTGSWIGLRFPEGSLAAVEHADHGWVPHGAASLPVHPTQLYEALLGLGATAAACLWLARGRRDGVAFATWIVVYAAGRFGIEGLRGDVDRGVYGGLSSAQVTSLLLVLGVVAWRLRSARGAKVLAATALMALCLVFAEARADTPLPPLPPLPEPAPTPSASASTSTAPPAPSSSSKETLAMNAKRRNLELASERIVTLRATIGPAVTVARPEVPSGLVFEGSGRYRFALGSHSRLEIGLEGRVYSTKLASHYAVGVPLELVTIIPTAKSRLEFIFAMIPNYNFISFSSPYFAGTNAWATRLEIGLQAVFGSRFMIGGTPLSFNILSAEEIGVITTWEPRLWLGVEL